MQFYIAKLYRHCVSKILNVDYYHVLLSRYFKYLLIIYHCTIHLTLSSPSNLVDQALRFPYIASRVPAIDYYLRRS